MGNWNIFECDYIATRGNAKMHIIDWIWTGSKTISLNEVGHFWKVKGFEISNPTFRLVDKQPQENAIIEYLS